MALLRAQLTGKETFVADPMFLRGALLALKNDLPPAFLKSRTNLKKTAIRHLCWLETWRLFGLPNGQSRKKVWRKEQGCCKISWVQSVPAASFGPECQCFENGRL
jgi:hypothetical protein